MPPAASSSFIGGSRVGGSWPGGGVEDSGGQRWDADVTEELQALAPEGDRPAGAVARHGPGTAARTADLRDHMTLTAVLDDVAFADLVSLDDHRNSPFLIVVSRC